MASPDIHILIADTLRSEGATPHRMPFSHDFFDIKYSSCFAPSTWTLPSHASLLSGEYPPGHNVTRRDCQFSAEQSALSNTASRHDYSVGLFSENPLFSSLFGFGDDVEYLDDHINYKLYPSDFSIANCEGDPVNGVKELASRIVSSANRRADIVNTVYALYERYWHTEADDNIGTPHHTRRVLDHLTAFISKEVKPQLNIVNLLETHNPHTVMEEEAAELGIELTADEVQALNKLDDDQVFTFRGSDTSVRDPFSSWEELYQCKQEAYYTRIRYLDKLLEDWINRNYEKLSESILILTSDHGELFGEEGAVGHQVSLHPNGVQVPLFIKYPKSWSGPDTHNESISKKSCTVSWTGLAGTLQKIMSGRIECVTNLTEELERNSQNNRTNSVVMAIDGPNWDVKNLKDRFDEEQVLSKLGKRKIGLVDEDRQIIYSCRWDSTTIVKEVYELSGCSRTLIDSERNPINIPFKEWLLDHEYKSISPDVSARLEDLGYL